jgi:hypothetical protein
VTINIRRNPCHVLSIAFMPVPVCVLAHLHQALQMPVRIQNTYSRREPSFFGRS